MSTEFPSIITHLSLFFSTASFVYFQALDSQNLHVKHLEKVLQFTRDINSCLFKLIIANELSNILR